MENFKELYTVCKETSAITFKVVDEFLLYYSAQREGLNLKMDQQLKRFLPVINGMEQSWLNLIKSQYIGHCIFKKDGFIKKYLQHAAIKELPLQQRSFLAQQSAIPWRFSFSRITAKPETDFFEMEDVYTRERYLLYSPSVSQILSEGAVSLWLCLIGFNGSCWQTYGPLISFAGFGPDDIFFFATELNAAIETDEALVADIENNPFPYLMLISGSRYPLTIHGKDEILQVTAEHSLQSFDNTELKKDFKIEYAGTVYRISLRAWSDAPHFAQAYYAEEDQQLLITALTDRGFLALVTALNQHGFGLPTEPDIRVKLSMLVSIKHILGKEIQLNPYEELFKIEPEPAAQEEMDKLNHLFALVLPIINAGGEPDIRTLAKEAGVDETTARELLKDVLKKFDQLQRKK